MQMCVTKISKISIKREVLNLGKIPQGSSELAIAVQRLARLMRTNLGTVVSQQGELSLTEWRICIGLAESDDVNQQDLVAFCQIQQAQVSRALAAMEARGLIHSKRSQVDRRHRKFSLTNTGQELFRRILPIVESNRMLVDSSLTASETKLFLAMSERIAAASTAFDFAEQSKSEPEVANFETEEI